MNRLSYGIIFLFFMNIQALFANFEKVVNQPVLLSSGVHRGMLLSCKKDLSDCISRVDALITGYKARYRVDAQHRSIAVEKPLSSQEKGDIGSAAKELDALVRKLNRCSPGDYDYLDVKNVYLPLLKEMQHQLHTFVMQPLGVKVLDVYDHARNILVPVAVVAIGMGIILTLIRNNLLPRSWGQNKNTLFALAFVIAMAGIIYNYRHILMPNKQLPLNEHAVDFDTLAWVNRTHETLKAAPEATQQKLALDVMKAVHVLGTPDVVVTF